jgi:hypothetical protein
VDLPVIFLKAIKWIERQWNAFNPFDLRGSNWSIVTPRQRPFYKPLQRFHRSTHFFQEQKTEGFPFFDLIFKHLYFGVTDLASTLTHPDETGPIDHLRKLNQHRFSRNLAGSPIFP